MPTGRPCEEIAVIGAGVFHHPPLSPEVNDIVRDVVLGEALCGERGRQPDHARPAPTLRTECLLLW